MPCRLIVIFRKGKPMEKKRGFDTNPRLAGNSSWKNAHNEKREGTGLRGRKECAKPRGIRSDDGQKVAKKEEGPQAFLVSLFLLRMRGGKIPRARSNLRRFIKEKAAGEGEDKG